jgi:beta-galactosidase
MPTTLLRILFVFGISFVAARAQTTPAPTPQPAPAPLPREHILFDDDWRFQKDDPAEVAGKLPYSVMKPWMLPTSNPFISDETAKTTRPDGNPVEDVSYAQTDYDDSGWRKLNLPHDWAIEGPFLPDAPNETGKHQYWGVGWYRKHFDIPASDQGKEFYLDVDGAMSYATVWINGQCAGGWPYGYASFQVDLTPYIQPGKENVVAIRLDNPPDSSRWYPGAGIYRHVWLTKTAPVHVAHWGIGVTTPEVSPDAATVAFKVALDNASSIPAQSEMQIQIFSLDANDAKSAAPVASSNWSPVTVPDGGSVSVEGQLQIDHPHIWDLATPNLYTAVTTVRQGDAILDSQETVFGVRTIKFDPEQGFSLNGRHVSLQGVCMHSDLGALGTALNTRALQRQVEILKEMGCNAIRTSHNPPSPELIDLCNHMGVLVMAESFDCWKAGKKPNDYHLLFDDWSERDLRAEIRHFRNDPSIILWSIGNEVPDQNWSSGITIGKRLTAIAHEEDPTRLTAIACNVKESGFNGFQTVVDVFGYNYKPWAYADFHKANPDIPLFGSETSSTVSSRGVYFFPIGHSVEPFQVTSYDNCKPPWATLPDEEFKAQEQNSFVAGEFVWTGFDYLGEPTPFNNDQSILLNMHSPEEKAKLQEQLNALGKGGIPSRSSYFGIVDLAGFKKDRFYLYQAHWRPDFPMAHLLPHWNWPNRVGQVTPVYLYTSGDEGELFLNGKSLGRKTKQPFEYRLRWDVPYQPGELEAVAYKNGKEWARDKVKTTGPVSQMLLQPDRSTLKADGTDLSFVTVTLADKDGLMVPDADNQVHFDISGPGDIVAVDNGDATDPTSFQDPARKAFNGLVLVVIRTHKGEPGAITLKADADGLPHVEASLTSQ